MLAVEEVTHVSAVVALFEGVGDGAAVHAVFGAAFEVVVVDVITVFAEIAVETPIAVFGVVKIIAEGLFVVHLVHVDAGGLELDFLKFALNFSGGPGFDFGQLFLVFRGGIFFIKNVMFSAFEAGASEAIVATDAVVTVLAVGGVLAVLAENTVIAIHAVDGFVAEFAFFAEHQVS